MKKLIMICLLFSILGALLAQPKEVRNYNKINTVVLKDIDNSVDPMAFMTNIHRHPTPQLNTPKLKTTPANSLIQRPLGAAPQPRLITTIAPGPDHHGGYPYDNSISVSGNGQVVTVTNLGVYVYNLSNAISYTTGYHSFLSMPGGKFDPQVVYDSHNDRYIVIILRAGVATQAGVFVAATATSDPTGAWNIYYIENTHTHASSWVDFPHLGVSNDRMYVHANIYRDAFFLESNIWDVPLDSIYAGGQISVTKHITQDPNIRFVTGAPNTTYGNKLYGVNIALTDAIRLYVFSGGNMSAPYSISTSSRQGGSSFSTHGKLLIPGGDASNSYSYVKDEVLYYAHAGTIQYEKSDTAILTFGKVMINPNNYAASTATTPSYIKDGLRAYTYAHIAYAGYSNDEGIAGSLITALYGSPTEYLGTISYHVDPDENVSNPLIVATGNAHVHTRIGDYIQSAYDPSGTREVWISGQFGSASATNAIYNINARDLYLGNVIAKVQVDEPTSTSTPNNKSTDNLVFPNPAIDIFNVRFVVKNNGLHSAKLYDTSGRLVSNLTSRRLKEGVVNLSFNAKAFDKGLYHLIVTDKAGNLVTKSKVQIH